MPMFRKKPVMIEAVQWTGENGIEISEFLPQVRQHGGVNQPLHIETLEGTMTAQKGDWIIKGVNGEFYPCKPDIFEKTYESLDA